MDEDGLRSRALSALLRHDPDGAAGLDGAGWAEVARVLSAARARRGVADAGIAFGPDDLLRIVRDDAKGRFQRSPDGRSVRAVSGHSVEVEIETVPFVPDGPLWFGTVGANDGRIEARGLVRGSRSCVRLSPTYEHALAVAEARVADKPDAALGGAIVWEVDAVAMAAEGSAFRVNPAGEVETDGVEPRHLSPARMPGMAP